ncbi:MAG: DUF3150 domain-containing protein, partial [Candidatus Cloacimonadota bacterium]|nr:DUF3150 domain-containing protein [Candidatus Cloacimonadota bacterium]
MNIQNKAMLVNLHIKGWTGVKLDRDVSTRIDSEYQSMDGGKYQKNIIAKDELSEIKKLQSETRRYFRDNTLPWDNSGARLLPTAHYFEFIRIMNELKTKIKKSEDRFIQAYPQLKTQAAIRLGKMYKMDDYPPVEEVKDKYHFEMEINAIPVSKDIRFSLSDSEVTKIRNDIDSRTRLRIQSAVT